MSGVEPIVWFYMASAAAAAGTVVSVQDQKAANKARQKQLEGELRNAELQALDEENRRLQEMQYANDDISARAGGIDAFASPSLIAAREFNFRMGMTDIENTRLNLAANRAGISSRISVLKANSRATMTAGIFEIASTAFSTMYGASKLKKPPVESATSVPGDGTSGIRTGVS